MERTINIKANKSTYVEGNYIKCNAYTPKDELDFDFARFKDEVKKCIEKVNSSEMTDGQKAELTELLDNANKAFAEGTPEAKDAAQKQYTKTINLLGDVGVKFVSVLSSFANIARFFGVSVQ